MQTLHGIQELAYDGRGYVYWRGTEVEHYDWPLIHDPQGEAQAQELADRCWHLEALGIPVNCTTAVWHWSWFSDMTVNEPYRQLMAQTPRLDEQGSAQRHGQGVALSTSRCAVRFDGATGRWVRTDAGPMWTYHAASARGYRGIAQVGQEPGLGACYATTHGVADWLRAHHVPPDVFAVDLPYEPAYAEQGLRPRAQRYSVVFERLEPTDVVSAVHTDSEHQAREVYRDWLLIYGLSGERPRRWALKLYAHQGNGMLTSQKCSPDPATTVDYPASVVLACDTQEGTGNDKTSISLRPA